VPDYLNKILTHPTYTKQATKLNTPVLHHPVKYSFKKYYRIMWLFSFTQCRNEHVTKLTLSEYIILTE